MKNKRFVAVGVAALAALLVIFGIVWYINRPAVSEGGKTITVEVIHKDESKKTFTCKTGEAYLAGVLVSEKIIEDDPSETGMFFVVDGEKAVYEEDQSYWAVYQNGEYAQLGINELPVSDGDVFSLVYTRA